MNKKWEVKISDDELTNKIANEFNISKLVARILANKGLKESNEIEVFLNPRRSDFHDPFLMPDMKIAVDRILKAIETKEKVAIYGDYDADGITSSTVLKRFLSERGLDADIYIPNRLNEGYGLNEKAIKEIAQTNHTLIITVDCGITGNKEIELAKTLKIDDKTTYNSGDCYVDTAAKKINIIMDMDYLKTKVGKLYSVAYTEKDFGKSTLISDKAAKVAHFDSGDDVYFALANNTLVMNNEKTAVLKNYASSSLNNKVKMVFTAVGTGKKDKFGNEIMDETAYVINGKKAEKMDKVFTSKNIVDKGNMFAFYTSYDYKKGAGEMKLFNGEKVISLSKQVSVIYKFA